MPIFPSDAPLPPPWPIPAGRDGLLVALLEPLHAAISRSDAPAVEALLLGAGSALRAQALADAELWGATPLGHAAAIGFFEGVQLLLPGSDLAQRDLEGHTPLMRACLNKDDPRCVALLIEGSDLFAKMPERRFFGEESALHFLALHGHARAIPLLANDLTARATMSRGFTPLMAALDSYLIAACMPARGQTAAIEALLPVSDLWARSRDSLSTPLGVAVREAGCWSAHAQLVFDAMQARESEPPLPGDGDRSFWRERQMVDWLLCSAPDLRDAALRMADGGADPLQMIVPSQDFQGFDVKSEGGLTPRTAWGTALRRQMEPQAEALARAMQRQRRYSPDHLRAVFRDAVRDSIDGQSWRMAEVVAPFCDLARDELRQGLDAAQSVGAQDLMPRWRARWEAAELACAASSPAQPGPIGASADAPHAQQTPLRRL